MAKGNLTNKTLLQRRLNRPPTEQEIKVLEWVLDETLISVNIKNTFSSLVDERKTDKIQRLEQQLQQLRG